MTASSDDTRSASRSDRRKPAELKGSGATASSDDTRSAPRSDRRKPPRASHYMIAPAALGMTRQALVDRENAAALRRSTAGAFVIEPDRDLRAASFAGTSSPFHAMAAAAMTPRGPGFTVTIQALSESGEPVEHAEVRLLGEQAAAQGLTGKDGRVDLTLHGERPETVAELFVNARSGYWGLWQHRPDLQADAVNSFTLEPLSLPDRRDWGGIAMRLDQLPTECRGAGIKIALIDSGIATSHKQLTRIDHGIDIRGDEERSWSQDFMGHGTPCAGLIGAIPDSAHGIRGYAPDAELHVCRLPPDARCSDLVAALDYCLQTGIDVACLGFGCERGSVIVEQRIAAAKQQGVGIIAAAGNSAGTVLFPACSPHVMAVGAVGQTGSYPEDSPQAFQRARCVPVAGWPRGLRRHLAGRGPCDGTRGLDPRPPQRFQGRLRRAGFSARRAAVPNSQGDGAAGWPSLADGRRAARCGTRAWRVVYAAAPGGAARHRVARDAQRYPADEPHLPWRWRGECIRTAAECIRTAAWSSQRHLLAAEPNSTGVPG